MNVIIFTTWTVQHFIPAVNVEIIENHLNQGDTVKVIACNSELDSCFPQHLFQEDKNSIPAKSKDTCLYCQMKWHSILTEKLKISNKDIIYLTPCPTNLLIPSFDSNQKLKQHNYQGINIGKGVLSTLISLFRDIDVDLDINRNALEIAYKNAVSVILTFKDLVQKNDIDKVYIFNGRISERRAVVEFCNKNQIDFDTWEVAQTDKHYYLVNKTLPHNPINSITDSLNLFYKDKSIKQDKKIEVAKEWYNKKRYGNYKDSPNDIDYTSTMTQNELDSLNFDPSKNNIAIFISSEDEIASLGEEIWPFKYRQTESIEKIISYFANDNRFHFYLRIHPNLKNVNNKETTKLNSIKSLNLTVIKADSPINSYSLLDACDKIVCFGSTIGIEATYWNKVSILFGTSLYKDIPNAIYKAETIEQLFNLILDTTLTVKNQEATLVYAYGLLNRGKLIKYLDIYDHKPEEIYKQKKLIYPFYKLYKNSPFIHRLVKKLNIHNFSKKIIFYLSKI